MTAGEGKKTDSFFGFGGLSVDSYVRRLMGSLKLAPVKGRRAIDLGCGVGAEALYMARLGYRVLALDLESRPQWGAAAREGRGRIRFSLGDAQALKPPLARYDLVFEKDMLHHTPDPLKALTEMARQAKPGGKLILIEANRWNPIFYVHLTLLGDHQHFSYGRLRQLLDGAGMAGAKISRVEARCWPINRAWAQVFFDLLQDLAQGLPFLRPFLCYHVAVWEKPAPRRKR
jgi:SAM-dependent methyltransferase